MAGLTLTTADSALKEDYQPAIREQLNNAVMFLQQIEKNSKDVEGRRAVLSLHVSRNSGVGARAEGGTLPTAGNQGYAEERINVRSNYGRITLTGQVIKAMRSDRGSFVRALQSETRGITTDLRRDVNRQCYGFSTGKLLLLTATGPSTTVVAQASTPDSIFNFLEVGQLVDIGTASPFTSVTTANAITSITRSTRTIVLTTAVTVANGDTMVRSGSGGSGAAQKELTGLQSIVAASGSLFNVDPSTNPSWVSTVKDNSGTFRPVSETLFAGAMQDAEILGGANIDLWITSPGVHRAYAALLTSQKRFTNTLELKGGYKALDMTAGGSSVPLMWDRDCPSNKAFGLATPHLVQFQMSDWEFMQEDGAVLFRVSGTDSYEATLFKYHELATDKRNAHVLVSDLTEAP
jgi:hypothetical protein